ncbi:Kynurenine--oxoglutarate transaminase 1 [Saguinus oedipus]|uniref:kynurenine--oxoglutarate transaminase n=1 Tax=Saguinus oedipus TaxID=9490 RepID=A0ABQ9WI27_SAGOE|nr:Kynurenine--oxoglutarate transaminase 1 [Saguinus oedipus]
MLGEELHVRWVSSATPCHLLLQSPSQNGELGSSSNWQLDPTELASKFTSRTKALVLNNPSNPVGKVLERPPAIAPTDLVFSREELELVASLCQQHDVVCITDEVYQWLVYDGHQHISIGEPSLPRAPSLHIGGSDLRVSTGLVVRTQHSGALQIL